MLLHSLRGCAEELARRLKWLRARLNIRHYLSSGRRPWTRGYTEFKYAFIERTLRDADLLRLFRSEDALPKGYGVGIDERVVEYPWFFSRMEAAPGKLLDAGSSLNFEMCLTHPLLGAKSLTILTAAPEPECFWKRGISYLFTDLREIPIRDGFFDAIACISTIEHVGMDNILYANDPRYREHRPEDLFRAITELRRVLRIGGRIWFTVPFGRYEDHGSFQQFDEARVGTIIDRFRPSGLTATYYRYDASGWARANSAECAKAEYFDIHRSREPQSDGAAAARAVACLELVK